MEQVLGREYLKYRWFFTSSEKLVVGGKSAEQNEDIMKKRVDNKENFVVMHTSNPGSPFTLIKNPNKRDLDEMAIFTACFSQQWKRNNTEADVDVFTTEQINKSEKMKTGTFGVTGKIQRRKAKLELALEFQKGKLRAVPRSVVKKPFVILTPGKLEKEEASQLLIKIIKDKFHYIMAKEEIMAAIPAKDIEIKEIKLKGK
ncbi:DUF814 domain-containing protein [Candidatus Pacearchaeota archaeon]|nr:DUF814 domain-containing protein [Candidatus Pacearchaeota archaeon]